MMRTLRSPLLSIAAMVLYLAANVGVRGVHHHPTQSKVQPSQLSSTAFGELNPTEADDDSDHDCLICSALHLAQVQTPAVELDLTAVLARDRLVQQVVLPAHPIPTTTRSRAPPSI